MPKSIRKKTLIWSLLIAVLSLDRLAKYLISKNISLNQSIPIIKNVFHISLLHNTGAAFGIFKNQNYLLIAISLLSIVMIYLQLRKKVQANKTFQISLVLILAGAIGNFIDRISFGYVIDFLDFRIWPVFNIADSSITIGVILLAYSLLVKGKFKS